MPARKPAGLITRSETKADRQRREDGESAMRPARQLPAAAPARLKSHPVAATTWRRLMRLYDELEAEVVTGLDLDLLVDYCLLVEQLANLDTMRKSAYQAWLEISKKHQDLVDAGQHDDAVFMAIKVVGAFDALVKLDTRADRKRDLLLKWRQSLYLTPRARAGVAPAKKDPEPPPDDLEQLLDDVTNYMNGDV